MNVAILVLNYNGEELLKECLPSVIEAAKNSNYNARVIVIDNCSTDKSLQILDSDFKEVEVIKAKKNEYLVSYNEVLESITEDIVILLNNDIKVDVGFIEPLLEHFRDKEVFYVAPKVLNFDDTFNGGKSYLKMKYGVVKVEIDGATCEETGITHTIACGAFRRDIFLKLGGYDSIYLPGYWEDTDICYKGLKYGLKGVYEPRSRIYHKEHASFSKKFSLHKKMAIVDRNMFIFTWKNIADSIMWCEHIFFLFPRLIFSLVSGRPHFVLGFFKAIRKIPEILRKRRLDRDYIIRDREIIK